MFHRKAAPALFAALNEIWDCCQHDQKKIDGAGISKYAAAYNHRMVRGSFERRGKRPVCQGQHAAIRRRCIMSPGRDVGRLVFRGARIRCILSSRQRPLQAEFAAADVRACAAAGAASRTGAPADELEEHPAPAAAPPNVQPLDPDVRGDPILYDVQRRPKALRYSPGVLNGRWGGATAGVLGGFMNDRGAGAADIARAIPRHRRPGAHRARQVRDRDPGGWRRRLVSSCQRSVRQGGSARLDAAGAGDRAGAAHFLAALWMALGMGV
ncbi:hypothetical protein IVA87_03025 [Bradyrhizobium sp. 147]|uniref:hypothetical protein n=1 Tax=unclassified Bradyrhizobium TaxID=2631580 RepID=UPI001FF73A08|nr:MULTISPECIES: hypothetical protein [unclassified Bradyrhizobium]MCK1545990.1 hypothetical protein [Bradyrhizobium sp. 179]MCK1625183.1 hypothetical protein [Bradyrhizobium sp. 160]MCK1678472.1 hypothetical protein [Bradyrhizobium sp. 147]